jgi:hypothetical protein
MGRSMYGASQFPVDVTDPSEKEVATDYGRMINGVAAMAKKVERDRRCVYCNRLKTASAICEGCGAPR